MVDDLSETTRRPPPGLVLRAVRAQDADALTMLINLPGFCWGTTRIPFEPPEDVRSRLEKGLPGGRSLVAVLDGEIIGNAALDRLSGRRAHVGRIGMGVHDDWVGRGIGTALMAALVDLADNWLGLRRLELEVNTDNLPALALYRRFGFEIEGTHRGHLLRAGKLVDGYSMARLKEPGGG